MFFNADLICVDSAYNIQVHFYRNPFLGQVPSQVFHEVVTAEAKGVPVEALAGRSCNVPKCRKWLLRAAGEDRWPPRSGYRGWSRARALCCWSRLTLTQTYS